MPEEVSSILLIVISEILRWVVPVFAILFIVVWQRSLPRSLPDNKPLAVLINAVNREKIKLMHPETSIGRSKSSDLVLAYPTISRNHAVISKRGEEWFVFDTNSKTGVEVNGTPVKSSSVLNNGDAVTLGGLTLMFSNRIID